MQIPRQRRSAIRMEMSPLIDCIFLLLIFFMLSSTFLTPAIKLTLPSASTAQAAENQHILVTLDAGGDVYVNTEQVALEDLQIRLGELLEGRKEKIVTLRGDKDMRYEHFVKALDAAKSCGAVHVNVSHDFEGK
jgi:biopolymer transport protein ExbD